MTNTRILAIVTVIVLICAVVPTNVHAAGTIGSPEVFVWQNRNFSITDLNFNRSERILTFRAIPYNDSWYNIGLAMFHLKFNKTHPPQIDQLNVYLRDETTEATIDMLKNYTYIDGSYRTRLNDIVECKYLQVYFYLFENKSSGVVNEHPMPTTFGPMWDDTGNDVEPPPEPMGSLSSINPSDDYNILGSSDVIFSLPVGDGENELPITTPIIILTVAVVALVILTYFIYKRL